MKKLIVWISFLVLISGCATSQRSPSLNTDQPQSPDAIARLMWKNFAFEQDQKIFGREEYWQTPSELVFHRKGDCEDFALFARTLLKRAGINAFLMSVYGDGYAHTVCVFKENGKYQVIDGVRVKRYEAESLTELVNSVYPFWKRGAIVDISLLSHKGVVHKMFTRSK